MLELSIIEPCLVYPYDHGIMCSVGNLWASVLGCPTEEIDVGGMSQLPESSMKKNIFISKNTLNECGLQKTDHFPHECLGILLYVENKCCSAHQHHLLEKQTVLGLEQ